MNITMICVSIVTTLIILMCVKLISDVNSVENLDKEEIHNTLEDLEEIKQDF